MAKKTETPINIVDRFAEFRDTKKIDKSTMINVLEESFRNVLSKMFVSDENFNVIMNPDTGDCEIYQTLEVVADGNVENKNKQIGLTDALAIDPECEIGEEVVKQIYFEDFGRRAILTLRQTLQSKTLEMQKDALYKKYRELEGEIISAEVNQIWKREMLLIDENNNELVLPKDEQIPGDFFHKGDVVRAVVKEVTNNNNNPKVIVSRTDERFLRRLFEQEVPEIHDGLITIKGVARIPGERAKIAVESYNEHIDPVGACVGVKGSRIHGIVRELRNENIDVISYSSNPEILITRALSPANIASMRIDSDARKAEVFLKPEEVSLAIGKGGMNIRLASMLTGYTIDVYRDNQEINEEDVYIDDFKDDIDKWIIDVLKDHGLGTAKAVLKAPKEVIDSLDLEDETIDFIMKVLREEFERNDDGPEQDNAAPEQDDEESEQDSEELEQNEEE